MSVIQSTGWCPNCYKTVTMQQKTTNHWLHLFLTFLSLGTWAIVWLLLILLKDKNWRCFECGGIAMKTLSSIHKK